MDNKEFKEKGELVVSQAKAIEIKNRSDYEVASSLGQVISTEVKEIKKFFKPLKADTKKAHQNLIDLEKESLKPYNEALDVLKQAMLRFEEIEAEKAKEQEEALKEKFGEESAPVVSTFEKKGQTRETWTYEIVDKIKFIEWCMKHDKRVFLCIDTVALRDYAKITKQNNLPGIRIFAKRTKII